MAEVTLPPGEYRIPRTLDIGSMALREGGEFVVTGTLSALENNALKLLHPHVLGEHPLASAASKRD